MLRILYDRNGKEIHKGNILKIWMGAERCLQDSPYIVNDMEELYDETIQSDEYLRITCTEVIGDINEKSELLKEEVK